MDRFFFILDLQKGFAGITTVELQKDPTLMSRALREVTKRIWKKKDVRTFFEEFKNYWGRILGKKKEYSVGLFVQR